MSLAKYDLNLLAVFDIVMQERSLTRAGKRLGLSQPAVSHALARMRLMMKDDLLVRGPDGMTPTQRAEELAGPIREALATLEIALHPQASRPEEMDRGYTIAVNGYTAYALTNQIVTAIAALAPKLQLTVVPSGTRSILDDLDTGAIDLALTRMTDGGDRFMCSRVMSDGYVAMLRTGHPEAAPVLAIQTLGRMQHLAVTSTGDDTGFLDRMLDDHALTRNTVLSLPFLAVPEALVSSDLVAILPSRVASRMARTWPLIACGLGCEAPPVVLAMTWHRRLDGHGEHRWLRTAIRDCLGARVAKE